LIPQIFCDPFLLECIPAGAEGLIPQMEGESFLPEGFPEIIQPYIPIRTKFLTLTNICAIQATTLTAIHSNKIRAPSICGIPSFGSR
jgi:hypothetical protein